MGVHYGEVTTVGLERGVVGVKVVFNHFEVEELGEEFGVDVNREEA